MYEQLIQAFPNLEYRLDYPLKEYTSFKVGGKADIIVFPSNETELKKLTQFLEGQKYCIIGNGTNLLVSDNGFQGVAIITKKMKRIQMIGNIVICEAGCKTKDVVLACRDNCLSGLEFAIDIPGTIGGLVAMNGGCYNKSVEEVICYVSASSGVFNRDTCEFGYRSSRFLNGETIYKVAFKLKVCEADTIEYKLSRFSKNRSKKQPKGNTCGSVFKNDGYFAGKVIDQVGLKGYRIGGAKVAEEHANFIISSGEKAQDIYDLIRFIKKKVYLELGLELQEEVRYIGEFNETKL